MIDLEQGKGQGDTVCQTHPVAWVRETLPDHASAGYKRLKGQEGEGGKHLANKAPCIGSRINNHYKEAMPLKG